MYSDRKCVSNPLRAGVAGRMDCKETQGNLGGDGNILYLDYGVVSCSILVIKSIILNTYNKYSFLKNKYSLPHVRYTQKVIFKKRFIPLR